MKQDNTTGNPHRLETLLLNSFGQSLMDNVQELIKQQTRTWPQLRHARAQLAQAVTRNVVLEDFAVTIQCNPARIVSVCSPVDEESIRQRPCFLCLHNLPAEQRALLYQDTWLILNNPVPLFSDHLVVSSRDHTPQCLRDALPAMISLVADLGFRFSAFYNGPACGASAPDHAHFQMAPERTIPLIEQLVDCIETNAQQPALKKLQNERAGVCYSGCCDNRAFFFWVTKDPGYLLESLRNIVTRLPVTPAGAPEPMLNLIIAGKADTYYGLLFPRCAHRPQCYFKPEPDAILVSPGAVDVAGLLILPRPGDFNKIDKNTILTIYQDVCHGKHVVEGIAAYV